MSYGNECPNYFLDACFFVLQYHSIKVFEYKIFHEENRVCGSICKILDYIWEESQYHMEKDSKP